MAKSKWFNPIRNRLLIETQAEDLLHVLQCGKVAVNVFLRRMHNFAIDMNWLALDRGWRIAPAKPGQCSVRLRLRD